MKINKKLLLIVTLFLFNSINCFTISESRINELANWFASGMQEVEKDYQKKVTAQQKNAALNNYTQTESSMKLLVDIYNYSVADKGYNSDIFHIFRDNNFWENNPPPKINNLNDLRNNENALIDWILKVYKSNFEGPKKDILQNFAPLVKNILKKERENINDYVFYHGHSLELGLTFDLFKEVESFLFYSPEIFSSENITDLNPKESINRYLKTINSKYTNADEVVKAWQPKWDDAIPELSALLLSTNIALFGNTLNFGENTFAYFINSTSILGAGHDTKWIDEIFKNWNFDPKYKKDLNDLYNNFMKADNGNLLQIFIPKYLINKFVYISQVGGLPYDWNRNKKFHQLITPTNDIDTLDVLDYYKNAKFPTTSYFLKATDELQSRIVLTPEFFDLNNNIKIFKYTTSELDGEFGTDYKKGLRVIVARMILDYILKNQNLIRSGNDTSLKKILYTIYELAENSSPDEKEQIEKEKSQLLEKENILLEKRKKEITKLVNEQEKKGSIKKELKNKAEQENAILKEKEEIKIAVDKNFKAGEASFDAKKYKEAIEHLQYVIKHGHDWYDKEKLDGAYFYLGESYYHLHDFKLAKKFLQEVYDSTSILVNRGEVHDAIKEIEKDEIAKIHKQYLLARDFFRSKNYIKAIEILKEVTESKLVSFYTDKANAYSTLADIYKTGGNGVTQDYTLAKKYATEAINTSDFMDSEYFKKELKKIINEEQEKQKKN